MLHTHTAGQAEHHQAVHQRHCVRVCTYQECAMPLRLPEFRMNENNGREIAWAVGTPWKPAWKRVTVQRAGSVHLTERL